MGLQQKKMVWEAAARALLYAIWRSRNEFIFKNRKGDSRESLVATQLSMFQWLRGRCKKKNSINWAEWLAFPENVARFVV